MAGGAGSSPAEGGVGAGPALPDQRTFYQHMRSQTATRDTLSVDSGDVDAKLKEAARVVRATYMHPYHMHASIATACAVADVQGGRRNRLVVDAGGVPAARARWPRCSALKPESVRIVFRMGPGCYGVNGADTVSYDAALHVAGGWKAGQGSALAPGRDGVGELRAWPT